jgi:hypothetical protein
MVCVCITIRGELAMRARARATNLYSVGLFGSYHDAVMRIGGKAPGGGPILSVGICATSATGHYLLARKKSCGPGGTICRRPWPHITCSQSSSPTGCWRPRKPTLFIRRQRANGDLLVIVENAVVRCVCFIGRLAVPGSARDPGCYRVALGFGDLGG